MKRIILNGVKDLLSTPGVGKKQVMRRFNHLAGINRSPGISGDLQEAAMATILTR